MSRTTKAKKITCRITGIIMLLCMIAIQSVDLAYANTVSPSTGKFEYIAYSFIKGIGDAPANSAEHFKHCCSAEYTYSMLKGDVRLTADNRIIMCHDPGFTLNSKGRIVDYDPENNVKIHDMTYKECLALKYEQLYKGKRVNVCSFDQYLSICSSSNKKAYITVRNQYAPELIEVMLAAIKTHNMRYDCVINAGAPSVLDIVRKYDRMLRLSLIAKRGTFSNETVDIASKLGNCAITIDEFSFSASAGMKKLQEYADIIEYAQENELQLYAAILDDTSYIKPLKSMGINGAQIKVDTKAPFNIVCGTVKITSVSGKTATLIKASNRKKVVIPPSVTRGGKSYKINTIEADAFTGSNIRTVVLGKNIKKIKKNAFRRSKARTLIIRTKLLARKNVKGSFRGSKLKYAQVTVGDAAANKRVAAKYRLVLSAGITGRTIKITP